MTTHIDPLADAIALIRSRLDHFAQRTPVVRGAPVALIELAFSTPDPIGITLIARLRRGDTLERLMTHDDTAYAAVRSNDELIAILDGTAEPQWRLADE
jgi:hypothetical protein